MLSVQLCIRSTEAASTADSGRGNYWSTSANLACDTKSKSQMTYICLEQLIPLRNDLDF